MGIIIVVVVVVVVLVVLVLHLLHLVLVLIVAVLVVLALVPTLVHVLVCVSVLPVDPAKDLGVVGIGGAVGDSVGPILGEAVLLGNGLEALGANGDLHGDVGLVGAGVVAPQRGQRLVGAAFTCRSRDKSALSTEQKKKTTLSCVRTQVDTTSLGPAQKYMT